MKIKRQLHERTNETENKGGIKRQTKKPWFYWFLFNFLWLNMQLSFGGNSFNYLFMGSQRSVYAELEQRRGGKNRNSRISNWNQKWWLLITRNWIKPLTQFFCSTVNHFFAWITLWKCSSDISIQRNSKFGDRMKIFVIQSKERKKHTDYTA